VQRVLRRLVAELRDSGVRQWAMTLAVQSFRWALETMREAGKRKSLTSLLTSPRPAVEDPYLALSAPVIREEREGRLGKV
jgi:hypothetical protein